jgi:hypothetical protein
MIKTRNAENKNLPWAQTTQLSFGPALYPRGFVSSHFFLLFFGQQFITWCSITVHGSHTNKVCLWVYKIWVQDLGEIAALVGRERELCKQTRQRTRERSSTSQPSPSQYPRETTCQSLNSWKSFKLTQCLQDHPPLHYAKTLYECKWTGQYQ